jgi:hypothetical protein
VSFDGVITSKDFLFHLKLLEKQEKANPKTSRKREIIKIRAKINEIKTKKPYKESMKQKVVALKKLRLTDPWQN